MNTCQRLAVNITVSISMTVLKAFSERPEMGARKLPAAPHMTKSILPKTWIVLDTASCNVFGSLTSTCAGMQVCPVDSMSSLEVWVRRSSLVVVYYQHCAKNVPVHSLSPSDDCIGAVTHLYLEKLMRFPGREHLSKTHHCLSHGSTYS